MAALTDLTNLYFSDYQICTRILSWPVIPVLSFVFLIDISSAKYTCKKIIYVALRFTTKTLGQCARVRVRPKKHTYTFILFPPSLRPTQDDGPIKQLQYRQWQPLNATWEKVKLLHTHFHHGRNNFSCQHCDWSRRWHWSAVCLCDKTQYGHKTPTSVFWSVSIRYIILISALINQSAMSNGYSVKLLISPIQTNMFPEYILCTHYNATLPYQNLRVVQERTKLSTPTQLKPDTETTTSSYQLITHKPSTSA